MRKSKSVVTPTSELDAPQKEELEAGRLNSTARLDQ